MVKKIISIIFVFLLFVDFLYASEITLNSKRYILYNLNDMEIIDKKGENERSDIASLTKIMTVIVAIENIDNYSDTVTISEDMVGNIAWDVAKVGFKKGEKLTYDDLLYGTMLKSGADAAQSLALSTSNSMSEFIDKMNNKVHELGLKNTHFQNVVGLYDKDNYSSAYDMAQILLYALKNEKFKTVFTTKEYTLTNGKKVVRTIDSYNKKSKLDLSYIKGAKTGFIDEGGYSLATIATLNDVDYLFISLNAEHSPDHLIDHVNEYNYFSENYSYKELISTSDKIIRLKTKYTFEKYVDLYYHKNIVKYLKNDFDKNSLDVKYNGIKEISAFTPYGSKLGFITVKYNEKLIDSYDVYNNTHLTFDYKSLYHDYEYLFTIVLFIIWSVLGVFKNVNNKSYKILKS